MRTLVGCNGITVLCVVTSVSLIYTYIYYIYTPSKHSFLYKTARDHEPKEKRRVGWPGGMMPITHKRRVFTMFDELNIQLGGGSNSEHLSCLELKKSELSNL